MSQKQNNRRAEVLNSRQIAALANVSVATVSRVIHTPEIVSEKTRNRVLQVIEQHGYVYNKQAADFPSSQSTMIGLIIPTVRSSIHSTLVEGIQDYLRTTNYSLVIGNTNYRSESELSLLKLFAERRVAGIIQAGTNSPGSKKLIENALRIGIPTVGTWECIDSENIGSVGINNFQAAYNITQYLIELGHRDIGLLIGPRSRVSRIAQRYEGFTSALKDHDIVVHEQLIIEQEHSLYYGREGIKEMLNRAVKRPTAVFAASDVLAFGAITGLKEIGIQVPKDISIAGFDDIDFAEFCTPPLTTVRVPAYEMGQKAIRHLMDLITDCNYPFERCYLDTHIIIRDSCRKLGKTENLQ